MEKEESWEDWLGQTPAYISLPVPNYSLWCLKSCHLDANQTHTRARAT